MARQGRHHSRFAPPLVSGRHYLGAPDEDIPSEVFFIEAAHVMGSQLLVAPNILGL
jgi:hypothetical protein